MLENRDKRFRRGVIALAIGAIFASGVVTARAFPGGGGAEPPPDFTIVVPTKRVTAGTTQALNEINEGRTGFTFGYTDPLEPDQPGVFTVNVVPAAGLAQRINILSGDFNNDARDDLPGTITTEFFAFQSDGPPPDPAHPLVPDVTFKVSRSDPGAPIAYTIQVRSAEEFNSKFLVTDSDGRQLRLCSNDPPEPDRPR